MIASDILFHKKSGIIRRTQFGYVVKNYVDFFDRISDCIFPEYPDEERNITLPSNSPFVEVDKFTYADGSAIYQNITPDGKAFFSCYNPKFEEAVNYAYQKNKDKSLTFDEFRNQCVQVFDVLSFGDDGPETDKMIDGKSFTYKGAEHTRLSDDAIETVLWYQKYFE